MEDQGISPDLSHQRQVRELSLRVFSAPVYLLLTLEIMERNPVLELPYVTRNIRRRRAELLAQHRDDAVPENFDELSLMLRAAIMDEVHAATKRQVPTVYANPAIERFEPDPSGRCNRGMIHVIRRGKIGGRVGR